MSMCHPNINLKYFDHPRLDHRSRVLKEKYCVILTQDFQFKVTVSFVQLRSVTGTILSCLLWQELPDYTDTVHTTSQNRRPNRFF